jgi:hypothetical protein
VDSGEGAGSHRQCTNRGRKYSHVSPALVEKYLAGMHFPADKKNLVDKAQDKDAQEDVMDL